MSFTLNYEKSQLDIKKEVKEKEFEEVQNYIPIYNLFFKIDEQSWNKISLNYNKNVQSILEKKEYNIFTSLMSDGTKKDCFIKFCPLFDPLKILIGKADDSKIVLPKLEDDVKSNFNNSNNSAYVDSFFTYLTSKLLHEHNFKHGLDCYGSYLAIKNNFRVDIQDDIEYLFDSEYFLEHKDSFNVPDELYDIFQPTQSCKYKKKLDIIDKDSRVSDPDINLNVCELDPEIISPIIADNIPDPAFDFKDCYNDESDLVYIKDSEPSSPHNTNSHETSSCSSRSSNTTNDNLLDDCENSSEEYESCESDEEDSESDDADHPIFVSIPRFPVNMVFLESCEATLDDYMLDDSINISKDEWSSILMQVIMSLIVYQEKFYCIHNDLHNANIMYIKTDKPYLYYKFNNKHYKVPTYGKIWKIIDFGRAIYKFKGNIIFSDSFGPDGDASSQYNCKPYLDENKKVVPPNFNFDLCRLACSLYDYLEDETTLRPIFEVVNDWLKDYKGRNILYKKNGEERYPEFKLYKMISRSMINNLPKNQLDRPIFSQYSTSKKNIKKKQSIMNIDEIPEYF